MRTGERGYGHPSATWICSRLVMWQQTRVPVGHPKTRLEREGVGGGAARTLVEEEIRTRRMVTCLIYIVGIVSERSREKILLILLELL